MEHSAFIYLLISGCKLYIRLILVSERAAEKFVWRAGGARHHCISWPYLSLTLYAYSVAFYTLVEEKRGSEGKSG